jgi:hypothetical protein
VLAKSLRVDKIHPTTAARITLVVAQRLIGARPIASAGSTMSIRASTGLFESFMPVN